MPVQCIAGLVTLGITAPVILAIVSPAPLVIKLLAGFLTPCKARPGDCLNCDSNYYSPLPVLILLRLTLTLLYLLTLMLTLPRPRPQ